VTKDLLIGGVVGAVLGIFAQFLTRPLERLLDRRLETRRTVRANRLLSEVARDRQGLRDFLMLQVLETTLVGALTGSATALYFGVVGLIGFSNTLTAIGNFIPLIGAVIVIRIAGDAISVARSVRVPSTLQASRDPREGENEDTSPRPDKGP
jgi:predicted PurR-regulated permease PerM